MKKTLLTLLATLSLGLSGCMGGVLVGGAAAVASTVHDRRSTGTVINDRTIERKISQKLLADKFLDSYSHTNLTIYNGVALITGEASSEKVAQRIIATAKTVPDVKRVESDLFIGPTSSLLSRTTDSAITTKVKAALFSLNIPKFDASLINVSTERGNVYLMGFVTRSEAALITQKASQVSGVKSVIKVFEYVTLNP